MGGNGSTARNVSFGLDENEKVTVIEGVKLSEDVLWRMRESQRSGSTKPSEPPQSQKPAGPSATEIQEEMRKNFERQQTLVQEQLAKLAQRERETAAVTDLSELTPALVVEKQRVREEQEKAKLLAKQLDRKEQELATVSGFYKEQLEILEKKNFDNYKQTAEEYSQAAAKTEARIRARPTAPVCGELQAKVLQCYRENPQQTLHCSSLAKQFMTCVQQAKKVRVSTWVGKYKKISGGISCE
uniref:Coiled-coil-helix-coiled-coil-helix domain containing 6b n=1 Tax=Kryptolebias marmoratus TaxID=37003 RepID=A0A3Q3EFX2_KRYMA